MTREQFYNLEQDNNLTIIETTGGRNGYPSALRKALVGFETFEEAQEFAKEHDLEIIHIKKRDGWQMWERGNIAWEAYTISADTYGDDYSSYTSEEVYFEQEVKVALESAESYDEVKAIMDAAERVIDELRLIDDNEQVITRGLDYVEVAKVTTMEYCEDVYHYAIAVIDYNITEEDEEE